MRVLSIKVSIRKKSGKLIVCTSYKFGTEFVIHSMIHTSYYRGARLSSNEIDMGNRVQIL